MDKRKNILVLAYQISPNRGSEYSVAWNYVKYMSKYHNLTVLYGNSGDYLGDNREMEQWMANNKIENVKFVFVNPTKFSKILNWFSQMGLCSYLFFYSYRLWHITAYQIAKKIIKKERIDLIHYLGPIGYREQGYLWKLDTPYMRGPMGGFDFVPSALLRGLPVSMQIKQFIRTITSKWVLKHSSKLRKVLNHTDLIIAATNESKEKMQKYLGVHSVYLPENCIVQNFPLNEKKFDYPETFNILMAGTLDDRKCNILLLKALAKTKHKDLFTIHLIGDGPTKGKLLEFVKDNGLDKYVIFYGKVSREKVVELFDMAHLHVLTSLSEANTTVIWEAMACGVPTLSLNHCGMKDIITEASGIKIPIDTIETVTDSIAKALDDLASHPEKFKELANEVIKCRDNYLWDERALVLNEFYNIAINNYKSRGALNTASICQNRTVT